jgi:hypothetical protein
MAGPNQLFPDYGRLLAELTRAVIDLVKIMDGKNGPQGTALAALVEVQGATLLKSEGGGTPLKHLEKLENFGTAIGTREDAVNRALSKIEGEGGSGLAIQFRRIVEPLLTRSSQIRAAVELTEKEAAELKITQGTRLSSVIFETKERGIQGLITSQMQQPAKIAEFEAKNIEAQIIPSSRASAPQVMAAIRQLFVNEDDAKVEIRAILSAIGTGLFRSMQTKFVMGRLGLLLAVQNMAAGLVEIGSSFSSVLITIIDIHKLMKAAGLESSDGT